MYEIADLLISIYESYTNINNFGNQIIMNLMISIKKKLGRKVLKGFKIYPDFPNYINITDDEINKIKKIPALDIILKTQYVALWSPNNWPKNQKQFFMQFWSDVRPILNRFYSTYIKPPSEDLILPVIHFRCSDIPFNRHFMYHLPKKDMIDWVINILKERKINKVIFLTCNTHLSSSKDKQSCSKIKDTYIQMFQNQGISITNMCNDIRTDLSIMFYSPLLISLNNSSFSFLIGISKPPNQFITSNMGIEINKKYDLNDKNAFDWIYFHKPPLIHNEVDNYSNLSEILDKIN